MDIYDKQIRTLGFEAFNKIKSSSVLIYGLEKGLGTEISKNLILMGVKNLYLYDNQIINKQDFETGYFYSEKNIELSRSNILMSKLQEISNNTNIQSVNNYEQKIDIMIIINQSVEKIQEISIYCRLNNIKLIVFWSKGVSGVIFIDAGDNHLITDKYDNIDDVQIGQIMCDGKVDCVPNSSHEFKTGDIVTFTNLSGENIEQLEKEWEITVINKTSFQLQDFNLDKFIFINGTCKIVKKPYFIKHNPFDINNPNDLIKTYIQMYSNNLINQLPPLWQSDQFLIDNKICIPNQAKLFHYELIPIVSIFGSIVSSETIKLVTNKYVSISQWFTWTDEILIPIKKPDNINYQTTYGLLYGIELEKKLMESTWLLSGFDEVGYEYIKILALMNIKNIIVHDEMNKKSNNHFLIKNNSDMNITFNKDIIESKLSNITGVINTTTENINELCFKYSLPLFNSSINGMKAYSESMIPFVTDILKITELNQEKNFPLCVITSFPNEIRHVIEFVKEQFEFFKRAPETMNKWLEDSNYLNTLSDNDKIIAEKEINLFTVKFPTQLDGIKKCREFAMDMFNENYNLSIIKLLESFPSDHKMENGSLFWSNGKKCPKPIIPDINDEEHLIFIDLTSQLLLKCSGYSETKYFNPNYKPHNLNIDDELHIKWIMSASNMRANNYSIPTINEFQTRGFIGKIIPSILPTSSLVSGLSSLEILKYLMGFNQIENYKNNSINLIEPLIIYSNPIIAPMIEIGGISVNSWTKFEYKTDSTLDEFKKYYEKIFNTVITMIVIETSMIYADFLDSDILNKKLSIIISEHFSNTQNNVSFNLLSNDNIDIPVITVNLI